MFMLPKIRGGGKKDSGDLRGAPEVVVEGAFRGAAKAAGPISPGFACAPDGACHIPARLRRGSSKDYFSCLDNVMAH